MSSWKSIIAGRESDVYYLLKELVETLDNKLLKKDKGLESAIKKLEADREELKKILEEQFDKMEENIKEGKKDSNDYYNQLFPAIDRKGGDPESLVDFETSIRETLKDFQIRENKTRTIKIPDNEIEMAVYQIKTDVKDILDNQIERHLKPMTSEQTAQKEKDIQDKILEFEKRIKRYNEEKKEIPKIEKKIEQLEAVSKKESVTLYELSKILDIPVAKKIIPLSVRRERDVKLTKTKNKIDSLKLSLKELNKKLFQVQVFLSPKTIGGKTEVDLSPRGDMGPAQLSAARRKEEQDKQDKYKSQIKKEQAQLNKLEKEYDKEYKDLNQAKLDAKNYNTLDTIGRNGRPSIKKEIKSSKGQIQKIKSDLEIEQDKLEGFKNRIEESEVKLTDAQKNTFEGFFENLDRAYTRGNFSKEELRKKIIASDLKVIKKIREEALKAFDNTSETIRQRIEQRFVQDEEDARRKKEDKGKSLREQIDLKPKDKTSVLFSEIFTEMQSKDSLNNLKEILNEKGFKKYLQILDEKIVMEDSLKEFKSMSEKEKNDYILDNIPKFQTYYTRILKILDDVLSEAQKGSDKKKIKKVETLLRELQAKFVTSLPKEERKKRKEGIKFQVGGPKSKTAGGIKLDDKGMPSPPLDMQLKEEEKRIYQYFFTVAAPKSAKSLLTTKVKGETKTFWKNLNSAVEIFTKNLNENSSTEELEQELVKFINKRNLHTVDILNLIGTTRTNKKREDLLAMLERRKGEPVESKPRRERKERKRPDKLESELTEKERKKLEERGKRSLPPSKEAMLAKAYLILKSAEENKERRMKEWSGSLKEMKAKAAKIKGATDSDEFDISNRKLHQFFTDKPSDSDKSKLFSFIDVNRKGEVLLRGYGYKPKDSGYLDILNAATSILKNLNTVKNIGGKEMSMLDAINTTVRKVYKYEAGRIRTEKKEKVEEAFYAEDKGLIASAIRKITLEKSSAFIIPKVLKRRMLQEGKNLRNEAFNLFLKEPSDLQKIPDLEKFIESFQLTARKTVDEMTELEEKLFQQWEDVNDSITKEMPELKKVAVSLAESMQMSSAEVSRLEVKLKAKFEYLDDILGKAERLGEDYTESGIFVSEYAEIMKEIHSEKLIELEKQLESKDFSAYQTSEPEQIEQMIKNKINQLKESINERPFDIHIKRIEESIKKLEGKLQKEIDEIKDFANEIETGLAKLTSKGIKRPKKGEEE
tara:strand:+ start:1162 stop:4794 length:3633 start_codon:yes stop_codon:yes gene_type:complete